MWGNILTHVGMHHTTNTIIHKHHHHGGAICPSYGVGLMDLPNPMQLTSSKGVCWGGGPRVFFKMINATCVFDKLLAHRQKCWLERHPLSTPGSHNIQLDFGGNGCGTVLCRGVLHPTKQSYNVDTRWGSLEQMSQGAYPNPSWWSKYQPRVPPEWAKCNDCWAGAGCHGAQWRVSPVQTAPPGKGPGPMNMADETGGEMGLLPVWLLPQQRDWP